MDKIDKFLADRCGVELDPDGTWEDSVTGYLSPWTIKDPRCREVCREKDDIGTQILRFPPPMTPINLVRATHYNWDMKETIMGEGETIAEAEMNCLQAIYKENNDE